MLKNEKSFPQRYYAKHFQVGTCKYDEAVIFVDNQAINEANKSFEGKPVYIEHKKVDLDNLKETADGYVIKSFFNPLDGWYWLEFIAITDEVKEKISQGWSVSNAYFPLKKGEAGSWHNNPYDYEVLELEFDHLAIVNDPRYEQSCIKTPDEFKKYNEDLEIKQNELRNSLNKKEKNGGLIMNLFKKKQEEIQVSDDVFVRLENGKEAKLTDIIAFVNEKSEEEEKKESACKYANEDDMVKVGKNEMTIKELKEAYNSYLKKNEMEEEEKKKEEEDLIEEQNKKKNEMEEEEKKKEEEENKNSKHFENLKNAIGKAEELNNSIQYKTKAQLLEEGRKRY